MKKDIRALSIEELREFFIEQGEKSFRADQVYSWLWDKAARDFEQMSNIPKELRQTLQTHYVINHIEVSHMQKSQDGTIKNAVKLHDGLYVESVLIPSQNRVTACVSSQVGCSLNCRFCATAKLKRMRNLNADEIFDQVATLDAQSKLYFQKPLRNIVFMGMGEPLMNYNNVLEAIEKISSPQGLNISQKKITVSTSGIPKMIRKMADEKVKFNLAVSLHSALEQTRNKIMPFTTSFPLKELRDALQYWYLKTKRRMTYEYVVWKGINDSEKDADALVKFCLFAPSKVNLIQYNSIDGGQEFCQGDEKSIEMYKRKLQEAQITVTVRQSKGNDIDAACGQLANKTINNL